MLHYPKLKIKTSYKTCQDLVSKLFYQIHLVQIKLVINKKNLPSTIPPGLGSLPSKASDKMHEKTSLKKRNLQHPESAYTPSNPLALRYTTPPLPLEKQIKVTVLQLQKTHQPTSRIFTTPLARSLSLRPCTLGCLLLQDPLSILHTACSPPPRGHRATAAKPLASFITTSHWLLLLPGSLSPSFTSKSLGLLLSSQLPSPNRTGSWTSPSFLPIFTTNCCWLLSPSFTKHWFLESCLLLLSSQVH